MASVFTQAASPLQLNLHAPQPASRFDDLSCDPMDATPLPARAASPLPREALHIYHFPFTAVQVEPKGDATDGAPTSTPSDGEPAQEEARRPQTPLPSPARRSQPSAFAVNMCDARESPTSHIRETVTVSL